MRKRLERDARREKILAGALEAFAAKGFGATNREIADAAGMTSPGLIYHYFPSKEELLWAVVEAYAPPLRLLHQSDALMELPLRDVLTRIASAYLELFETPQRVALMRVVFGEGIRRPEIAARFAAAGPVRMVAFLRAYFERQMERGVLRRGDPDWAARAFIGPLVTVAVSKTVLGGAFDPAMTRAELVENAVETFLHGMAAAAAAPGGPEP